MDGDVTAGASALMSGAPMPVPGDVIGDKYRIEAVLGRGGMSVVYRATHLQLDQQVAIKILSTEALLMPEYIIRLKREARAVSRIRSEHVVRVHDIGELPVTREGPGVPYLVMEHLAGYDLAAVLARGPMAVDLAVECILQSCEALAEAHALGIVHRDLKPANLFLTESVDGSPCIKVLDFGISRMSRRHGLTSLTDPGTVLGTPSYMAPEQMEAAETVDARSDIWALGTILYELLVGKPPYTGDSLPQIFLKIMRSRRPRPSASRAGVPAKVDAVVARCLAIEPSERFANVAELAWALARVGTPHARDSAARISRVFDKHSSQESSDASSTSTAEANEATPGDGPARGPRALRHVTAGFASVAILASASVFGVLAAQGAVDARPRGESASPAVANPGHHDAPAGAAVMISPTTRPRPRGAGEAAPLAAPRPAAHVVSLPRDQAVDAGASAVAPTPSPTRPPLVGAGDDI